MLVDAVLTAVVVLALLFFWVASASIGIEETHAVGNDSNFDRLLMLSTAAVGVAAFAVLVLRRPVRKWRRQTKREQELERLYSESARS